MYQKFVSAVLGAAALGVMSSPVIADGHMPRVEVLAAPCAGCHGPDGSSYSTATPSIAGITEEYFIQSMNDYISGDRPASVMNRIAKGYSEEEIKAMATYFSKIEFTRHPQPYDAGLAEKGKPLFQNYCESCHEEDGYKADGIGIMAGQSKEYLRYMVADFFSGDREWEKRQRKKMQALMDDHGQDGYEAVLHYMASKK